VRVVLRPDTDPDAPLPPLTLAGPLPDEGRAAIAGEWWYRAWAERDSAARYARLHGAMASLDAPATLRDACRRAGRDETRHAQICAAAAARFEVPDPFADRPIPAVPLGPGDLTARRRLLYEMTAFGCVTESLNAALLLETHDRATEPGIRAAVHGLLADEVQHAKLGWGWLAWSEHQGEVAWLASSAPGMLRAAASTNLSDAAALCARWSAPELGYLAQADRVAIFVRCAVEVIAPGLARFGVDPELMLDWLEAQPWV